jgi:AAHS family 4-hydroxybenzoate transporter-like MFS transporter
VVALAAEYVLKRMLPVFVAAWFSGIPFGSMVCRLVSSWMIPSWGWRAVLYLGGVLPLAISLVLIVVLPESIQFLIVQGAPAEKLRSILVRLSPEFAGRGANLSIISRGRRREGCP